MMHIYCNIKLKGDLLPQDNKNLRPSRKEIFDSTKDIEEEKEDKLAKGEINRH
jgi:hypothetical protein